MPIRLICVCGRVMTLPDRYVGEGVQCPDCGAMLRIPSVEEDMELARWFCECGQRLKARARSAGRTVTCPRCGLEMKVPFVDVHSSFVEKKLAVERERRQKAGQPSEVVEEVSLRSERRKKRPKKARRKKATPETEAEPVPQAEVPAAGAADEGGKGWEGGDMKVEFMDDEDVEVPVGTEPVPVEEEPGQFGGVVIERGAVGKPAKAAKDETVIDLGDFLDEGSRAGEEEKVLFEIDEGGATGGDEVKLEAPGAQGTARGGQLDLLHTPPLPSAAATYGVGPAAVRSVAAMPTPAAAEEGYEEEDEGIISDNLSSYFNAEGGADAARSGVQQVLNGHWLYIPYALLAGCMTLLIGIIQAGTRGQAGLQVLLLGLSALVSVYLGAAFVGCVKDGVFERSMGIERMLWNGIKYFPTFLGTCALMLPVGAIIAGGIFVVGAFVATRDVLFLIMVLLLAVPVGFFLYVLFMIPPVISILEQTNPIYAVGRGAVFVATHLWTIFVMTVVSVLIGGGLVLLAYFVFWLAKLLLFFILPIWLFRAVNQFFGGLVGAAIMGQLVSAVMILRLSGLEEDRLQDIRRRMRGPWARPWLLYGAIALLAGGMAGLSYRHCRMTGLYRPRSTRTYTPEEGEERQPRPLRGPRRGPRRFRPVAPRSPQPSEPAGNGE